MKNFGIIITRKKFLLSTKGNKIKWSSCQKLRNTFTLNFSKRENATLINQKKCNNQPLTHNTNKRKKNPRKIITENIAQNIKRQTQVHWFSYVSPFNKTNVICIQILRKACMCVIYDVGRFSAPFRTNYMMRIGWKCVEEDYFSAAV